MRGSLGLVAVPFVVVSHSVLRIISHPSSPSIYYRLCFYLSYLERSISASCTAHTYLHMQEPCGPSPPHPQFPCLSIFPDCCRHPRISEAKAFLLMFPACELWTFDDARWSLDLEVRVAKFGSGTDWRSLDAFPVYAGCCRKKTQHRLL